MNHGGAFVFGNSVQYNDSQILDKFVQHDIIFVLPAFRVGFFGFIDVGEDSEEAPYNVGLYGLFFVYIYLWVRSFPLRYTETHKKYYVCKQVF
jgi:carboxylesterase type B